MIELINIEKVIGDKVLFSNLNINFIKGSFNIITGISGSGKSTLLNIIAGLDNDYKGDIVINKNNIKDKYRIKYFDYLFQNYALVETETIKYNFDIVKKIGSKKINELLALVNLDLDYKQYVHTLSGGEQQRLAIARLILSNRDYILADEPTSSLDINNRDYIIDMLISLNKQGKTIILVCHDEYVINYLKKYYPIYLLEENELKLLS